MCDPQALAPALAATLLIWPDLQWAPLDETATQRPGAAVRAATAARATTGVAAARGAAAAAGAANGAALLSSMW